MAKPTKTNAARLLGAAGVSYEIRTYSLTMDEFSATAVAEAIGMAPATVFKTLVAEVEGIGHCFAVVPGDRDLDLKALAGAAGGRRAAMVPVRDVQRLTGYVRGAVTALGARKHLPTFVDESATTLDEMAVSGGARGVQLVLGPGDYVKMVDGVVAALGRGLRTED
jgi:Cys-tRNA(Pro)/Cys-tRNA(Cys) deacylase